MPDRVIAPLRELRQPLHDGLRYLPAAAAAVTSGDTKQALAALSDALAYLQGTLVPLCRSEQFTLFPAVDGVLGSVGEARRRHRPVFAISPAAALWPLRQRAPAPRVGRRRVSLVA